MVIPPSSPLGGGRDTFFFFGPRTRDFFVKKLLCGNIFVKLSRARHFFFGVLAVGFPVSIFFFSLLGILINYVRFSGWPWLYLFPLSPSLAALSPGPDCLEVRPDIPGGWLWHPYKYPVLTHYRSHSTFCLTPGTCDLWFVIWGPSGLVICELGTLELMIVISGPSGFVIWDPFWRSHGKKAHRGRWGDTLITKLHPRRVCNLEVRGGNELSSHNKYIEGFLLSLLRRARPRPSQYFSQLQLSIFLMKLFLYFFNLLDFAHFRGDP